ncbi:hypothetical protein [uncultured Polaribacter sp.]|uniref:hypothetical protein n=1 Tax=uncultured Polaribacter sp. TaxID=174711 RepID=UPI0030DB22E9|tara:strand:+ start:4065 stop:5066 length:1002 start_codon:yes stop_codon:yes gene_type:complete
MKKYIYIFGFIICASFLVSNSAQPGVWNAGGSGAFTLLYPEDTIAYKKIQMKSEAIFMQLYKGFATVKGTYHFKNTASDTLKIKVGYPINAVFENIGFNEYANQVVLDDLYKIKGFVNRKETVLYKKQNAQTNNWYVWEITFPPNKITEFTVYFLVNTNNASTLEGYNSDKKNAFIYLIETGSLWKSPIEKGVFYTQFKDNLSIDNVKTSSPASLYFDRENTILKFSLSDYGKTPDANFVVTYGETLGNFNFKKITEKSHYYFNEIDAFSSKEMNLLSFDRIALPNVYKVDGIGNFSIHFLYTFLIYGIPFLLIVLVIIMLRFVYLKFIKKTI